MSKKSLKTNLTKGNQNMSKQINAVVPIHSGVIDVDGEVVRIKNINIHQPALARSLSELNEQERSERLTSVLNLGQLIFEMSENSKEMIQFQGMVSQFISGTEKINTDGRTKLEQVLSKHADSKSEDGLVSKVKTEAVEALWSALDLENEQNPLKPLMTLLRSAVMGLSESQGIKEAQDNSPHKGGTFNERMNAIHQSIATSFGDTTEYVNDVVAANGKKHGDQIYDISPEITGGIPLRIVSEFKTEKNVTIQSIKKEIDSCMITREAQAGIFFVNREGKNESWAPSQMLPGNRFVVVVDKDDIDFYLVRNAIMQARIYLLKSLAEQKKDEVDIDRLMHLFDKAQGNLKSLSNVKTSHTLIETGLRDARLWVDNIDKDLKSNFKEIEEVLMDN
jgi:hypothetical protein